jgi:hypothetical protein
MDLASCVEPPENAEAQTRNLSWKAKPETPTGDSNQRIQPETQAGDSNQGFQPETQNRIIKNIQKGLPQAILFTCTYSNEHHP